MSTRAFEATEPAGPRPVLLADYRAPDFLVERVDLEFDLDFAATEVHARLTLLRRPGSTAELLTLDGVDLQLLSIAIDGQPLAADQYRYEGATLSVAMPADRIELYTHVRIRPDSNHALEGLYRSGEFLLTQCEAEGFRHITFFPDRPDVMARYSVTLRADRARFPVLLANGNPEDAGVLADGRHFARWVDPHPKPSYLFALVAGRIEHIEDRYETADGRSVILRIYSAAELLERCRHAMQCLKRAMRWDEQRFGRCYDLDVFNIVATHDFTMGAMENKGLNIFNARYLVVDAETATDADYRHVDAVVAHEYFHNWTGNRVTCRDWFQLALKEGLTVYREQEYSAEVGSAALKRIEDVRGLKGSQFVEDAGPLAHPVRPAQYVAINNFYTATVYEKGAEIVRMLAVLLGRERFRRGLDLYFARHDGQAVTVEDLLAALGDANGVDLGAYRAWYTQAGTPLVRVHDAYDAKTRSYTLTLEQSTAATPGQPDKQALPIPVAIALLDRSGQMLPLRLADTAPEPNAPRELVLRLNAANETFRFVDLDSRPLPSLLRGLSAPVRVEFDYAPEQLAFLVARDTDAVNRYEAAQRLAMNAMLRADTNSQDIYLAAMADVLDAPPADAALAAELLTLPDEALLAEQVEVVDPAAIHHARRDLEHRVGQALAKELQRKYLALRTPVDDAAAAMAARALKNRCLELLTATESCLDLAWDQYRSAANMSDRIAALTCLVHNGSANAADALADFAARFASDALVLDKWFAVQAASPRADTLRHVERLLDHDAFSFRNPNKVRALLGSFVMRNRHRFHAPDGSGYRLLAGCLQRVDREGSGQVAARLAQAFNGWRRFEPLRRGLMQTELERLAQAEGNSRDLADILQRALA